jgi:hypothetical protein
MLRVISPLLLVLALVVGACGKPPATTARKWVTVEKPMASLDDLKDGESRRIVAAATRKDTAAGVPFGELVKFRMTMGRGDDGNLYAKGFAFDIVVSDHAAFLATLSAAQRAEYRRYLARAGAANDAQIAAFTSRVRVLLSHEEGDRSPERLKLSDAQVLSAPAREPAGNRFQISATELAALSPELQVAVRAAYGGRLVDPDQLPKPVLVTVAVNEDAAGTTAARATAQLTVMDHRGFLEYLAVTPASADLYLKALRAAGATLDADGRPDVSFAQSVPVTLTFDDGKRPLLLSAGTN